MHARHVDSMVSAHRDWHAELEQWAWTCDPPASQRAGERDPNNPKTRKRKVCQLTSADLHSCLHGGYKSYDSEQHRLSDGKRTETCSVWPAPKPSSILGLP